jgi:hypothetical protein
LGDALQLDHPDRLQTTRLGDDAEGEWELIAVFREVTAKSIEYPPEQLELADVGWLWRLTALFALTVTATIGVALLPAAAAPTEPTMTPIPTPKPTAGRSLRAPVLWGVVLGAIRPRHRWACGGWIRRPSTRCR